MKKLKFFAFTLFAVLACVNLSSCSDDDDKDAPSASDDNFASVIIGAWTDDDAGNQPVYCFHEDGSYAAYHDEQKYVQNRPMEHGTWSYNDGLLKIYSYDEDGDYNETYRPESVSQNKIVLKHYYDEADSSASEYCDGRDEYGYYDLWTLERYID